MPTFGCTSRPTNLSDVLTETEVIFPFWRCFPNSAELLPAEIAGPAPPRLGRHFPARRTLTAESRDSKRLAGLDLAWLHGSLLKAPATRPSPSPSPLLSPESRSDYFTACCQ